MKLLAKAVVSSEGLTGRGSTSRLTHMIVVGLHSLWTVGLRTSVSCWLLARALLCSTPYGSLNKAAHNVAAGLLRANKQEKHLRYDICFLSFRAHCSPLPGVQCLKNKQTKTLLHIFHPVWGCLKLEGVPGTYYSILSRNGSVWKSLLIILSYFSARNKFNLISYIFIFVSIR